MSRPSDPREPDDLSIVPGLGPSGPLDRSQDPDRYDPARDTGGSALPPGPLDRSKDPDRYDPATDPSAPGGRLDRSLDPDRYPPGQGQTLTDLLGDGAQEQRRDGLEWAYGLLGVLAFLALVSWFFTSVAKP